MTFMQNGKINHSFRLKLCKLKINLISYLVFLNHFNHLHKIKQSFAASALVLLQDISAILNSELIPYQGNFMSKSV